MYRLDFCVLFELAMHLLCGEETGLWSDVANDARAVQRTPAERLGKREAFEKSGGNTCCKAISCAGFFDNAGRNNGHKPMICSIVRMRAVAAIGDDDDLRTMTMK